MQYFFILGTNAALSVAELMAKLKFNKNQVIVGSGVLFYTTDEILNVNELITGFGGTIKIGQIVASGKRNDKALIEVLTELAEPKDTGKYCFGFSSYLRNFNPKPVAMAFKTALKTKEISARWVVSREPTLSSVVVETNKLITNGWDVNLFEVNGEVYIGRTLVVQPFKELSNRDFGRPSRDDHSGMLPPKLAQIMINLAQCPKDEALLDPFCGSGTILTESLLMGYKKVIGSDLSVKAVADSINNCEWILSGTKKAKAFEIKNISATELSGQHKNDSIMAIVTEPFLGPQRGEVNVRVVVSELEALYAKSIKEFYKILKPSGRVVMVWPVFKTKQDRIFMSTKIAGLFKIKPAILDELSSEAVKLTNRKTIVYGRDGQKVWREIVILQK
ncbi:MAG: DNA methyltransferase [bacterium]